jgi:serine/threonine protein kinase
MKIIGKYQGAEEIGRSAAGVTCRARDPFRNRDYVLKVLSPLAALSAASKDRLYRDLAVSWDLTHRHIAKLQDIGELEGIVYIATELLEGCSLVDFLAAAAGSLPEKLTLMAQVCEALACAHSRGIAHGNVKPNNIFITDTRNAAVLDFGTGTWQALLLASGVRLNGLLPNYLAPEQILGEPFDARSDIFSAGVVLYELLAGQYPFQAAPGVIPREIVHAQPQSLREWNLHIPEELDQAVFRALSKDPRERFQNADELAANLYSLAQKIRREPPAPPPPPTEVKPTVSIDTNIAEPVAAEVSAHEVAAPTPEITAPAGPVAAPGSERGMGSAEASLAAEAIQAAVAEPSPQTFGFAPAPTDEPVPPPELFAPRPVTPAPPAPPPAPVPPMMPVAAPQSAARRSSSPKSNSRKRRLVTFATGAVMALSMVGVIVVRQNFAAPRASQPASQTPAAKQTEPAVIAPDTTKPTPFTAPAAPATPVPAVQQETPADPAAEQILRGQVRPLWEAGQYADAMRLVDQVLASNPVNAEARGWKRRIRAAQDAESEIK